MNLKKTNTTLLTIVGLLLFLAVLVLIKILFSDAKGFEWGSVSDWFSTIANSIMAGSAIYAAFKAGKWLNQNMDNDAYILTKKIIIDDYTHIRLSIIDSHNSMFKYSHLNHEFMNPRILHSTQLIQEASINFKNNANKIYDIDKSLILLKKVGYEFRDFAVANHKEFRKLVLESIDQHNIFWSKCLSKEKKKSRIEHYDLTILNHELISSYKKISSLIDKLEKCYVQMTENDLKIMDYIKAINIKP